MLEKLTPYFGWSGFFVGLLTAVLAMLPGNFPLYAVFTMLPGFLLSSAYVMLSTRYKIVSRPFNPGYLGMALNSVPLILILYFTLTK